MKKIIVVLLALSMILSFAACGSSGKDGQDTAKNTESSAKSKESSASVEEWDMTEEFEFSYSKNVGDIFLFDTEEYRISVSSLQYSIDDQWGKILRLNLKLENFTDSTVDFDNFNADDMDFGLTQRTVEANSSKKVTTSFTSDSWNGLIGETNDCYLGTYLIRISTHDDTGFAGETLEEIQFDWYASKKDPCQNITSAKNAEPETVEDEPVMDEYMYDITVAENEYYRINLRGLRAAKNDNGTWDVYVELVMYNTYGSNYLLFDPGKQSAGYDPGRDWFTPDNGKFFTLSFTSDSEDLAHITGDISYDITGYSWDGSSSSKMFEQTLKATLKLAKTDPVVSAEIVDK